MRIMFSKKVLLLAHGTHCGIHEMLRSISKTRPKVLIRSIRMLLKPARHREASAEADGQFGIFNAQHFMNRFPKVAKIARKRLFTS